MFRGCGHWILGICAVALGAGILIAAVFPVGALMFLVAVLMMKMMVHIKKDMPVVL